MIYNISATWKLATDVGDEMCYGGLLFLSGNACERLQVTSLDSLFYPDSRRFDFRGIFPLMCQIKILDFGDKFGPFSHYLIFSDNNNTVVLRAIFDQKIVFQLQVKRKAFWLTSYPRDRRKRSRPMGESTEPTRQVG